jgi:hypothetical protein
MKSTLILRTAAAGAFILTSAAACDNVSWGGADVTVVPPPPRLGAAPTEERREPEPQRGPERLPDGPILYHVRVEGATARLEPVAEIVEDSLRALQPGENPNNYANALIAEHMREGAEFVLFHDGGRVGTFIVQSAAFDGGTACRPLPSASGILELSADGQNVREFVALARQRVPQEIGRPIRQQVTRSMQVIGPILAERIMRARRAGLPGNWERAFAQVTPFPIEGSQNAGFAATFLVGDTLGPGLDDDGYAVLFLAVPRETSYDTAYVSYRPYEQGGKQAPRVIEVFDWNRDGSPELLLRVFGTSDSWLEALGRDERGRWRRVFDDRCNVPRAVPAETTGPSLPLEPGEPVVKPDTMLG